MPMAGGTSMLSRVFPRSQIGRVGLVLLVCLSFFINIMLQGFFPCKTDAKSESVISLCHQGDADGRLVVALTFAHNQLEATIKALRLWEIRTPCSLKTTRARTMLLLYSDASLDADTDLGATLRAEIKKLQSVQTCFSEVVYVSAGLRPEDNTYNKGQDSHLWVRGPNQLFYTLVLRILRRTDWSSSSIHHMFWSEPDNIPIRNNWLEHLLVEAARGPYWMQGSAYRGKCLPEKDGNCTLIGRAIRSHINGNSLYHVGDGEFVRFVQEVAEGEWQHWPFDLAMLKHMQQTWPEHKYRNTIHLYQLVDWTRNYGPYPYKLEELPEHVVFIHADKKPAIEQDFPDDKLKKAEPDRKEEADKAAVEQAVWMRGEIEKLKKRLGELEGNLQAPEEQDTGASAETTRPSDPALLEVLKQVANAKKQVLLAVVSGRRADLLENFVHFVEKAGAAKQVLLAPLDFKGKKAAEALKARVGGVFDTTEKEGEAKSTVDRRDRRYKLILRVLQQGYNCLSSDLDVVWLKNPFQYFLEEVDFLIQSDSRTGYREEFPGDIMFPRFAGTGIIYSLATKKVIKFFENLKAQFITKSDINERDAVNGLLGQDALKLNWRLLEPTLFPNGAIFFEKRLPQAFDVTPVAVHNNWVQNEPSRIYRFREGGFWSADSATVTSKNQTSERFLAYFDALSENGLNNQRQGLRNALLIAKVLNRTLILPQFHSLHLVDSVVPLDFFFDYDKFLNGYPHVLPHSYLKQGFPYWDTLPVQAMDVNIPPLPQQADWLSRAVVKKPKNEWHGATEDEIKQWYGNNRDQLLVFFGMFRRFGRLNSMAVQEQFNREFYSATMPNPRTLAIRDYIVEMVLQASRLRQFNCFHLRHGKDFQKSQKDFGKVLPLPEIAVLLTKKLLTNTTLYLATDIPGEDTRKVFEEAGYEKVVFMDDFYPSWEVAHIQALGGATSMRKGQIDQQVCSKAVKFVGNEYSTFTFHIAFVRQMAGLTQVSEDIYDRDRQDLDFI